MAFFPLLSICSLCNGIWYNKEIKALLLKAAEKTDDSSASIDNEEDSQEDTGTQERQVGSIQPESGIIKQNTQPQSGNNEETSTEEKQDNAGHLTATESVQTEEQPSSFFDNLLNILMKPFSLIGSFFGGFFSWLFGSNEERADSSDVSLLELNSLDKNNDDYDAMESQIE